MKIAMDYEKDAGRTPENIASENMGYDIRSVEQNGLKIYIEVKGRNKEDGVMLSENEMNRLSQLENSAWLYIVINCKSNPELFRIQNPGNELNYEIKSKGIQYYVPLKEWKKKIKS